MKKLCALLLCAVLLCSFIYVEAEIMQPIASEKLGSALIASVKTTLKKKMATRSGPGTKYTSTGTFPKSTEVSAIEKYEVNGTYWVLVDFKHKDAHYRAYTGLKRLNISGKSINTAKYSSKKGTTLVDAKISYGPGSNYASYKKSIPAGTEVKVVAVVGDYLHVDVKHGGKIRRGYVKADTVSY